MRKTAWSGSALVMIGALTVGVSAQRGEAPPAAGARLPFGGARASGNPTPGTAQPDPPNPADRVSVTGCVQAAPKSDGAQGATTTDPNTPSDSRFLLTNAARKNIVPAGTGGSALAAKATGRRYRLEAMDSQLSPFVGAKVEVSGEIKPPASNGAGESRTDAPTLRVEFVQKIAPTCS